MFQLKFGRFVCQHKKVILGLAFLLLIPAIIGMKATRINYDILVYLPEDIETIQGEKILSEDFNMGAFSMVVVEDMKTKDIEKLEDKIKEIDMKEKVQFTLSIAVSNEGPTDKEKYKSAQTAMDIVLGRGGDQAVIRENEIYKFFGGRAQEVEKRTKVKARIVAQALENLMNQKRL